MKELERVVSKGVMRHVSPFVYNELFNLVEDIDCFEPDATHRFSLRTGTVRTDVQIIEHEQADSGYMGAYRMKTAEPVTAIVWVFVENGAMTMVLENEIEKRKRGTCRHTISGFIQ
jgi:hypothetical protein